MEYATTPVTNSTPTELANRAISMGMSKVSTRKIIWHLIKRHKFFLVSTWAVIITILWLFPPAIDVILSIFN